MKFIIDLCCKNVVNKLDDNQKEIRNLYFKEENPIKKEELKQLYDDSYNDYFNSLIVLENMTGLSQS